MTNLLAILHFVIVTNWYDIPRTDIQRGYVRSNTIASFVFERKVVQVEVKSDVLPFSPERKKE